MRTDGQMTSATERLRSLLCHACAVNDAREAQMIYGQALDALAEVLAADRGAVIVVDADGAMRVKAAGGLSKATLAALEADVVWPPADPRTVAIPNMASAFDAQATPQVTPEATAVLDALASEGVAAAAFWPLPGDEGLVGMLVACYNEPHTLDDDERRMAEILAAQIGASLTRRRAETGEHRLSHSQLRGVLNATGEGIIVRGPDGRLVWANAEAARLLGVDSVEELLATPPELLSARYEVFDEEGSPVARDSFPGRHALHSGGESESQSKTVLRYRELATGEERWVRLRAQQLPDARGNAQGSVTVFRDITRRQLALLARDESQARLSFLASTGRALLAASLDSRSVLQRVADLLVPDLADYCAVREVTEDGSILQLAVRHADPAKAGLVEALESYPIATSGPPWDDLREGRPFLLAQITDEQLREGARDEEHLRLIRELNPRSVLAVPVRVRGRTVGVIVLVSAESGRTYGESDVLLVDDVAHRAGLAFDNARLYETERRARAQAEATRSEIAFLLDASTLLASSLDYEEGLERLARLAAAALCDLCLIDLIDPENGSIRRVAAVAADPDDQLLADTLQERYPPDPAGYHPAVRVMRTGQPEFSEDMVAEFLRATTRDPEHERITQELGFRSFMSVPLAARGRILGAMTLIATTRSDRRYGTGELALAADLARRAALELDNTRLFQETELQKALLTSQSEAAIEGVLVISPEGRVLSHNRRFAEMWAIPASVLEGRDADSVLHRVGTLVADRETFTTRVQYLREHRDVRARDEIILADGRVFDRWTTPLTGGDGIYRGRAWYFRDVSDLKRAQEERTRLYEAERRAYLEAETSRSRLQFLVDASTLLAGSLDVDAALMPLACLVVESLADWCAVDLIAPDGGIVRAAAASSTGDAAHVPGAEVRREAGGLDVVTRVIRSRRPILVPDARLATAPEQGPVGTPSRLPMGGGHGEPPIGSYLAVPLVARSRVLGCLSLAVAATRDQAYGPDDLALAQDLARRVALALDNAALFGAQRHIAMTLQQSLLPPSLPEIPGVELAARYRAASPASEVGGDFYDLFPAGDGAWAFVMGDISGKGVEAASLTALARYTVRAAAREHRQPREILFQLNEAVMDERPTSRFLTIVFGRLRWRPAGLRLTVACGGHPPPLLLREKGTVERAARPGTLIGFLPSPDLPEKVNELKLGDVVVFFTDGLTDVRGPGGIFGEERVVALLAQCRGLGAEEIAARLEAAVLAFQEGEPRDDLALLVLRVTGLP